jgi:DNA-binding MarR family transcriptional regulator
VSLTAEGAALVETAPLPVQHKIVAGMRRLSSEEIEQIIQGLTRLTGMLDDQGDNGRKGSHETG